MTINVTDTFTIITGGICALNFGEVTAENSTFGISIKGGSIVGPCINTNATRQIAFLFTSMIMEIE